MKRTFTLSLILFASIFSIAQEKKYLITIKEGQYFNTDDSKVIPKENGFDWEVVVEDDNRHYFKYTETAKNVPVGIVTHPGAFMSMGRENGMRFYINNVTGEKYGPLEDLSARYDENKKVLYGYSYKENGQMKFVDLRTNKSYEGGLWFIDEENLVYSYNEGDQVFLNENGKIHGPYQQVSYKVPALAEIEPLITYKLDDKFYVSAKHCKDVAFDRHPVIQELKDGWLVTGSHDFKTKIKYCYHPNGNTYEKSDKLDHLFNYKGDVLKCVHEAGGGSYAAFNVSYNGNHLGTFALKTGYREDVWKSDFFNVTLMGVTINSPSSSFAKQQENFYFSPTKGLLGPIDEDASKQVHFFSGGIAYIADSVLNINGKETLKGIAFAVFRDETDWYAFQKRGDYLYPFRNGKEIPTAELPDKYKYFDTEDKHAIKVQRKDEFYIRVKGKDKLYGPVRQYDGFSVSDDGEHWATERGDDGSIIIDGKVVGKGYKLSFNNQLKAFHWWNVIDNKVYLYTFKV